MKRSDIMAEEVFNLWRHLRPTWTKVSELPKEDEDTVELIVPLWALVCWDAAVFCTINDLKTWLGRVAKSPLDMVVDTLKAVDNYHLQCYNEDEHSHLSAIVDKDGCRTFIVREVGYRIDARIYIPFINRINELFREGAGIVRLCSISLRRVRTAMLFLSHLTLHKGIEEDSIAKFDKNLDRIAQIHTLPSMLMKQEVRKLLEGYSPFGEFYRPHHGNGRVAELPLKEADLNAKWLLVGTSAVKYSLRNSDQSVLPSCLRTSTNAVATNRVAKVITVPKGISKRRIVCPEPAALMFMQQGMLHVLTEIFERKPQIKKHVNLLDATLNAELACTGSISRQYATIDLSSASDSVRWEFVEDLFSEAPEWQRALRLTRSTHREYPDGRVEPNVHYAPMGSALCFPIQIICYFAIIKEAAALAGCSPKAFRIYGDDIIIPEALFECTCSLLDKYGFIVNQEKTFHGLNPFRESCGGHYLNGYDVTPVLCGRQFAVRRGHTNATIGSLIDLGNRLIVEDYPVAHRAVSKTIVSLGGTILYSDRP